MAAPHNDWVEGTLYLPGGPGGFFYQPDGPFTKVLPQVQVQANSDILTTVAFSDLTGRFIAFCSHSFMSVTVYRDFDYDTGLSVALLTCPICSAILRTLEPFDKAVYGPYSYLQEALLFP